MCAFFGKLSIIFLPDWYCIKKKQQVNFQGLFIEYEMMCVCVYARVHISAALFPSHSPFYFAIVFPLATQEIPVELLLFLSCIFVH